MALRLNLSVAVDVTRDAGLSPPASMLIVQTEVVAVYPGLDAFRIAPPSPLPQDPGPNGVFVAAAAGISALHAAAPCDPEQPWTLFVDL